MLKRAQTIPHLFTATELEALPTITVGQADDLKFEDYETFRHNGTEYDGVRVWLGNTEPEKIFVEYLRDGRWIVLTTYNSRRSRANP